MLEKIIEVNNEINKLNPEIQTMVPCFYGTSGTGKTTRVRNLAKKLNLKLETILLHSMLSEEVCGLPRYNQKTGKTVWTLPEWFDPENPKVYLFDELDKVKEDELGLLLTMFASKEVRGIPFPEGSIIVCAMQPIIPEMWTETETGQALISRLIFIPINNGMYSYLESRYRINLNFMPIPEVKIPILPYPNPRQVEYYINVAKVVGIKEAETICQYMIDEKFIKAINESLTDSFSINKEKFVQKLNKDIKKLDNFDIYQLIDNIGELWHFGNSEVISEVTARIILEGTFDEYEKMISNLYNYFDKIIPEGASIEIANGEDEDRFYKVFEERMKPVAQTLKQREEGEKK